MSIFSKIRGAKKAAEQHKGAQAQNSTGEPKKAPYKHVPTHAAIDAMAGAPAAFKEEDREAIKYQNKRRSAMSRNNSDLSAATSINTSINRNSSYTSNYTDNSRPSRPRLQTSRSRVGFQGHEGFSNPKPQIGRSPLASQEISPTGSSSNSTHSSNSQVLELPVPQYPRRNVGEAPILEDPPLQKIISQVEVAPIEKKRKRMWSFGKRSSAIAAH